MKEIEITKEQVLEAFNDIENASVQVLPDSAVRWESLYSHDRQRLDYALEYGQPIRVWYIKEHTYGYYTKKYEGELPECDGDCKNCKRK